MQTKACIKQNFWDALIVSTLSNMPDLNTIFPRFLLLLCQGILEFGANAFLTPKLRQGLLSY